MSRNGVEAFAARKTPVQARSAETVEAIFEAAIQVLLAVGASRLTTTRVAARAGVSVGTLYQYFPNKEALLHAVMTRHLENLSQAVVRASQQTPSGSLEQRMNAMVDAFIEAKFARPDVSLALYEVSAALDGARISAETMQSARVALVAVLSTNLDLPAEELYFAANLLIAAMGGAMRTLLETGATPALVERLRTHLKLLCGAYLAGVASVGARNAVS